ncbi:alpha-amylase [Pediococcus claussenii]|uniref:alpha-amylase family glycosyl hydrolase n=1 Tax=Pediococcus claussenii TaxID=187452 RepID=UPI00081A6F0A|nr:alpha-amylase family glycosyl hydrolase [Pediococcus claussenii]ANZ69416.1 alpha-amylase [Pediococcus claussenii]
MARDTDINLRSKTIYSVFVRNYSEDGKFKDVLSDLDRIKSLGTDIIWLMPINSIGVKDRKGMLGSPYAIQDYYAINPELGDEKDFKELIEAIHARKMKVMIDIVFNHTSKDSLLIQQQPEWFLHDEKGMLQNKNPEWTDVAEFDFSQPELWSYLLEVLKHYAELVDGFRCDVAPQVPIDFWVTARKEIKQRKNDFIWLAESTDANYIRDIRGKGYWASSDGELYNAFDMTYDYDIDQIWRSYIRGEVASQQYVDALNNQSVIYPANAIKMRGLENHDQERAYSLIPNIRDLFNWTAFSGFQSGSLLIYNGQEFVEKHTPSLFEKDVINWASSEFDFSALFLRLHELMQDKIQISGVYAVEDLGKDILSVKYRIKDKVRIGIFPLKGTTKKVLVDIDDGTYKNMLLDNDIKVTDGTIDVSGKPILIEN